MFTCSVDLVRRPRRDTSCLGASLLRLAKGSRSGLGVNCAWPSAQPSGLAVGLSRVSRVGAPPRLRIDGSLVAVVADREGSWQRGARHALLAAAHVPRLRCAYRCLAWLNLLLEGEREGERRGSAGYIRDARRRSFSAGVCGPLGGSVRGLATRSRCRAGWATSSPLTSTAADAFRQAQAARLASMRSSSRTRKSAPRVCRRAC